MIVINFNWKNKNFLYYKINQFFIENGEEVNINLERLCAKNGWNLISYPNEYMGLLKSISNDGFSIKWGNEYFIFYNPELKADCYERYRFTVAHEIGHIYLFHHIYVNDFLFMSNSGKALWEMHADTFAQNILMPLKYKTFYKNNNLSVIMNKFAVSKAMASTRINKIYEDEMFNRRLFSGLNMA